MSKKIKYILSVCAICISSFAVGSEDPGLAALEKSAKNGTFTVAFFFEAKGDADRNGALKASVEKSAQALTDKVSAIFINMDDETQQGLVKKFRLRYAPKPIVLTLAPSGTVVGSFQQPFTVDELRDSLPGPGMQQCIQALQEQKLVMICVQNKDSIGSAAAMKGASGFVSDPRFKAYTTQVVIDPSDADEANSLKQLQIAPESKQAATLLLAPPGSLVGKWDGAVSKETIVQQLTSAMSRSGGCGSGSSCFDPSCQTPPKGGK
jgi:hypothetical protein